MKLYEVKGAVVRLARKSADPWGTWQKEIINHAKQMQVIYRTVRHPTVRSPVDGRIIVEAREEEFTMVRCVIEPDLTRHENAPDLATWKLKHPVHRVIEDDPHVE